MIGLAIFVTAQAATIAPSCTREAVEQRHLVALEALKDRIDKLVEERRSLMIRRAEIAKRSVKLAETNSIKRGLSEEFGKSQEDLERLDVDYTARINTIAEEADGIKLDRDAEQVRYDTDISRCRIKWNAEN